MNRPGRLFLIPTWLSEDTPPEHVVPAPVIERIRALDRFVAENAKSARRFIASCGHPKSMRDIRIWELNEHTAPDRVLELLEPVAEGHDVGVLSEAGVPAVADPGASLVAVAHAHNIQVIPMIGPSSILLALMASGLEGQRFRFVGYLPAESAARRTAIAELERRSKRDRETQLFIETPYRNDALLADLLEICRIQTRLCVAVQLTSPKEWIRVDRIANWKAHPPEPLGKRPAIFLLLA